MSSWTLYINLCSIQTSIISRNKRTESESLLNRICTSRLQNSSNQELQNQQSAWIQTLFNQLFTIRVFRRLDLINTQQKKRQTESYLEELWLAILYPHEDRRQVFHKAKLSLQKYPDYIQHRIAHRKPTIRFLIKSRNFCKREFRQLISLWQIKVLIDELITLIRAYYQETWFHQLLRSE